MVMIKKAAINDALVLTNLARNIYKDHYLHLWHPGGAEWYMNEYAYAMDKIKHELLDPGVAYFIAFEEGKPVGYLKLLLSATLAGFETSGALEVERIYLYKKDLGKGIGKQLMQLAMQYAIELKKDFIFLKAMDSSLSAIEFYEKLGYTIIGDQQLPMPTFSLMKEAYRGMVILKKNIEK